jgi:predicted transcriptional regulator
MDASELKLKIFREIDTLEKRKLEEVYGYLQNFIRAERSIDEWNELSEAQKQGLLTGIKQIELGQTVLHEDVMEKYRKKYSDG